MAILERKMTTWGTVYWRDQSGKEYGRVVMGAVWPGSKPGFAVVLGEDELKRGKMNYYVLAELEEPELQSFIRACYDFAGAYAVTDIYGDPADNVANEFLARFNEELRTRRQEGFYVTAPPLFKTPDCFEYCCRTIQKHTGVNAKTLHIGEKSRLAAYLLELRPDELKTAKAADYPAIAALGYALTSLDAHAAFDPVNKNMNRQEVDYDIFTFNQGQK